MAIIYRTADLSPGSGREIFGVAVPYGPIIEVVDFDGQRIREQFEYGAFKRSIHERGHKVRLLTSHNRHKLAVGRAAELREEQDGLHASFDVANTRDGDELLELVKTGVVDSFSIGFEPVRERRTRDRVKGDLVVRIEAKLFEVSAVNFPAYETAQIAGVRSQTIIPRAVAERRLRLLDL